MSRHTSYEEIAHTLANRITKNKETTIASTSVLVGADPELFCVDKRTKAFVSASDLLVGTNKHDRTTHYPLQTTWGEAALLVDGTAFEFNITPSRTHTEFRDRLFGAVYEIKKMLPKNYNLVFDSTASYPLDYYDKLPESSKELGCVPDYDAYCDGKQNPTPPVLKDSKSVTRAAGGHIHVGWTDEADADSPEHMRDCIDYIRNLDALYTRIEGLWEPSDSVRRQQYGKPGCFRPKSYGVEYRTPSAAWINAPGAPELCFEMCRVAYSLTNVGVDLNHELETLKMGPWRTSRNMYDDLSKMSSTWRRSVDGIYNRGTSTEIANMLRMSPAGAWSVFHSFYNLQYYANQMSSSGAVTLAKFEQRTEAIRK